MRPWKTLSRHIILKHSKYLVVENHTVELPDGRVIPDWPWIITPDYVIVLAVTDGGEFLCLRQTKYAVSGTSLAPVGGFLETKEDSLAAAKRELLEETGYEAPEWISLGRYVTDGNRGSGTAFLFLARGAHQVTEPTTDDLEEQELLLLTRPEMESALAGGEFKVLAWAAAIALALQHMK